MEGNSSRLLGGGARPPLYGLVLLLVASSATCLAPIVYAATATWDGGGGFNSDWNNVNNWDPNAVPAANDDLVFPPGASRKSNTNDLPGSPVFRTITLSDSGYTLSGNQLQLTNGLTSSQPNGNNTINLGVRLAGNQTFRSVNAGTLLTFNGAIEMVISSLTFNTAADQGNIDAAGTISGGLGITKNGPGTLRLLSSNTYNGGTFVNGGTLRVQSNGALGGTTSGTGVSAGARLQLEQTPGGANLSLAETIDLAGGATLRSLAPNFAGGHILSGDLTSSGASNTITVVNVSELTLGGRLFGAGTIVKNGEGTLILTGSNQHTGGITVEELSLVARNGGALGSPAPGKTTRVLDAGTLQLENDITVNAPLTLDGGRLRSGARDTPSISTWSGPITVNAGASGFGPQIFTNSSSALTVSGPITGNAPLRFGGSGRVELSGPSGNSYTGETRVNDATLVLNKPAGQLAIPGGLRVTGIEGSVAVAQLARSEQIADTASVRVDGPDVAAGTGVLDIGAHTETIGGLEGSGTARFGGGNLNAGHTSGQDTGVNVFSGKFEGNGTFATVGSSIQVLAGNNPGFAGKLQTLGGTLQVDGDFSGAQVEARGGTLRGSGTVGAVAGLGGTIFPSRFEFNSPLVQTPAILTTGNVAISDDNTNLAFTLNSASPGSGHSQLRVRGTVELRGGLGLIGSAPAPGLIGSTFVIVDNDGTDPVVGTFSGLPEGAEVFMGVGQPGIAAVQFRISYRAGDGNDVVLTLISVNCGRAARTAVSVSVQQLSPSLVQATLTAASGGLFLDNRLSSLVVTPRSNSNARVTVPIQPGVATQVSGEGPLNVAVNPPQPSLRFTVQPVGPGPATAFFTVFDLCGGWESLAGAGEGVFGQLGTFAVTPDNASIPVGELVSLAFRWTVPATRTWHDLASLELRLVDERGTGLWVRWEEASDGFSVIGADGSLELSGAKSQGSGPIGQSVTLTLPIRAEEKANGRSYRIEVLAQDDTGARQGFEPAGTLAVGGINPARDGEPKARRLTPEQLQQRRRTDSSNLDDTRTAGDVLSVACDERPPRAVIANRDGPVVLRLWGEAALKCESIRPGGYVQAEGEKEYEGLYEIDQITIST